MSTAMHQPPTVLRRAHTDRRQRRSAGQPSSIPARPYRCGRSGGPPAIRTASMLAGMVVMLCLIEPLAAESALPLLSGFDRDRIARVYPPTDDTTTGELAKLLYRLRRLDPASLNERLGDLRGALPGDVVAVSGRVTSIQQISVPPTLAEYVDAEQLEELEVATSEDGRRLRLVTVASPDRLQAGDRVAGTGVVIGPAADPASPSPQPAAVALADLRWFPRQVPNVGWRLLRDAGVNIAAVAELASRNRRPLVSDDNAVFYEMLAAADAVGQQMQLPPARRADAVHMLSQPDAWVGQWLSVELETVQITRVFVTNPQRRQQLNSDHYFQIDAVAELDQVVIKMEPATAEGEPALFEGRFPISVVTRDLPEFLRVQTARSGGADAVVTPLRTQIGVTGFFFRLWSYASPFMDQHGGGNQIGPLLMAAQIRDLEPAKAPLPGLELIGILAAIAVVGGVLLIALVHYRTA